MGAVCPSSRAGPSQNGWRALCTGGPSPFPTIHSWKPEGVLTKLYDGPHSQGIQVEFKRVSLKPSDVTDERLLSAYRAIAEIVAIHGEAYLPIFERPHSEVEHLERKSVLLDLARTVDEFDRSALGPWADLPSAKYEFNGRQN